MQGWSPGHLFCQEKEVCTENDAHTQHSIAKRGKEQVLVLVRPLEHLDSAAPEAI